MTLDRIVVMDIGRLSGVSGLGIFGMGEIEAVFNCLRTIQMLTVKNVSCPQLEQQLLGTKQEGHQDRLQWDTTLQNIEYSPVFRSYERYEKEA